MTKKSFVIILVLSVITSYVADLVDAVVNNTLLGGKSGFPFKDNNTTMFGGGTVDGYLAALNILFWFIVIFILWKLLQKVFSRK